jgi:hypothetical protein
MSRDEVANAPVLSRYVFSVANLLAAASMATAQLDWQQPAVGSAPAARHHTSFVPDSSAGGLLLFGGSSNMGNRGDTWRWRSGAWQEVFPLQSPPARYGPVLASDSARGRIVLFGGADLFVAPLGDTWEWDGANWSASSPASSPPARYAHAMTFDAARGRTLLFGGFTASGWFVRDTWEWDGVQWVQRTPPAQPPVLYGPQMAFDPVRAVVVMSDGPSGTWEWDGLTWTRNASAPPAPNGAMAWDPARERMVWYGGSDSSGNPLPVGVYDYDGNAWMSRSTATNPPARYWHVLAYDADAERLVMFGGRVAQSRYGDTWLLGPVSPARIQSIGSGCPSSAGLLNLTWASRPWLGDSMRLILDGVPAGGALAVVVLGVSSVSWSGWPLPLTLGPLGMNGCSLYVSVDALATTALSGTATELAVPVPPNTLLVGRDVFAQVMVFDPAANAAGAATSNAIAGRVGSR